MAVKKTKTEEVVAEQVEIETPAIEEPVMAEERVEEKKTVTVEVDPTATEKSVRKEGNVRVRMRVDHKCNIAMVRYDLKKGETYTVPENVKKILDSRGLLAPLN